MDSKSGKFQKRSLLIGVGASILTLIASLPFIGWILHFIGALE